MTAMQQLEEDGMGKLVVKKTIGTLIMLYAMACRHDEVQL